MVGAFRVYYIGILMPELVIILLYLSYMRSAARKAAKTSRAGRSKTLAITVLVILNLCLAASVLVTQILSDTATIEKTGPFRFYMRAIGVESVLMLIFFALTLFSLRGELFDLKDKIMAKYNNGPKRGT